MDTHLVILRQAADMAEKAEMGKLQMDWDGLDEDEETARTEEETHTRIETTPLVDKGETSTKNREKFVNPTKFRNISIAGDSISKCYASISPLGLSSSHAT